MKHNAKTPNITVEVCFLPPRSMMGWPFRRHPILLPLMTLCFDLSRCFQPSLINEIINCNELRLQLHAEQFLAKVNSRSRSLYVIVRPSVCLSVVYRLSYVMFVHPNQCMPYIFPLSFLFYWTTYGLISQHPERLPPEVYQSLGPTILTVHHLPDRA